MFNRVSWARVSTLMFVYGCAYVFVYVCVYVFVRGCERAYAFVCGIRMSLSAQTYILVSAIRVTISLYYRERVVFK